MPVLNLTDRAVAAFRPGPRQTYFDENARGLALRITPRSRTWYLTYRNNGPSQWLRLGEYPALSLANARKQVTEQRALLDKGIDPATERRKPPVVPTPAAPVYTFADFVPVFVRFQKGRTKHWEDEEGKINRYLLPAWGPLPLKAITRLQVAELLDTVESKGLTSGTNRVQAVISRMFTVALNRGLIDAHPAARIIKRFTEQARDRVLTDEEIRGLWSGLDAQPGAASDAVRLRLLLGQRGQETAGMLWHEVDLDAAHWSLPATRTKNKHPHVVALPSSALAVLKRRRETLAADEDRVFPDLSLQGEAHKALAAINQGAYEWTDLRRTVSTRLAGLGFDDTIIGRVLNHARVTVTAKHYNKHLYLEEIRQALTTWDRELQRILANEPKSKTNVLPIRRRR